jgi:hypothetical protein
MTGELGRYPVSEGLEHPGEEGDPVKPSKLGNKMLRFVI